MRINFFFSILCMQSTLRQTLQIYDEFRLLFEKGMGHWTEKCYLQYLQKFYQSFSGKKPNNVDCGISYNQSVHIFFGQNIFLYEFIRKLTETLKQSAVTYYLGVQNMSSISFSLSCNSLIFFVQKSFVK